ncbi:hypothetical protein C0992_003925 [Termitomyces sp. T32_za158]|nr:hypothetical protein C0992_003925 [Termitomyces sp. T32_za158]
MMFSFATTFILAILSLFTLVASAPVDTRDVYVPPVVYPSAGTVWQAGSTHNVTWDISNPPKQITNKRGMIVLAKGNMLIGLDTPLAKDFDILNGKQEVTIPVDTAPADTIKARLMQCDRSLVAIPAFYRHQSTSTFLSQGQTASTMLALMILCISYFFSYVHASPLMMRDVFSPHITSPNETTVWPVGTQQTVTWETDNIPPDSQLTDPNGKVVLGHLGPTGGLNLDIDHPLAQNFKLRVGHVQITVPSVPPRDDYIIVLFGDSGNTSPTFAITRITDGSNSTTSTTKPFTTTTANIQHSSSAIMSTLSSMTEPVPSIGTTTTGRDSAATTPTITLPVSSVRSTTSAIFTQIAPTSSPLLLPSSSLSSLSLASMAPDATSAADSATTSNSAWASRRLSTWQTPLTSIGVVSLLALFV